jgi:5-methyltetrahydrofolate--homocysteine methyltransferase
MIAKRDSSLLLSETLARRILVVDGAMGTMLQGRSLTAEDFGGARHEGCNEHLNVTRPDVVRWIHEEYLRAGADIVSTNSFGCAPYVLGEYGLAERTHEIALASALIAREAADRFSVPERPRFVAGAMGPGTKTITVTGGITFDQVAEAYYVQARALIEGGVDALLLETAQDTLNVKAATVGIKRAQEELRTDLPLMVSATIEPMGTMLAGQGVEALCASLEHLNLFSIGLNCATGPEFMTDHIRSLSNIASCYVTVYPNAGLPDENGHYEETPESLAGKLARFVESGWVNAVGGCCGTTPAHIRVLAETVKGKTPRRITEIQAAAVSGIEALYPNEDTRPVLIGERTNVIGSKKFRGLIAGGQFEEAAEIGRAQVKGGAQVLDVCLANPDRDEAADMDRFMEVLTKKVKVPLMIDTTDPHVLETALKRCQGKAIVNSINLEDGEERFQKVVPLIRKYGAAVVVGMIDEDPKQGMAVTRQRKLAIAERSFELLTGKYDLPARDLIFDALVFPAGTGDENYIGSAVETIEGVRLIKARFPICKTLLGTSNVSFGLPPAGREALNAVFLYHATKAGVDYAIVNAERLERYAGIPERERKLAEDLLFRRRDEAAGGDPVGAFAAYYKEKQKAPKAPAARLTLDQRLARHIVEGSKDGLIDDLDAKLKEAPPIEIINGPLMNGMEEVGRLFNDNQLIVAEVLQSAEAMKTAVAHLERFMEKAGISSKGKILLATVKGDVHDIGKNLVEIILSNNGYAVINLGIKVPPETLIHAFKEHAPDAIGLSGLLVKSAQQMVVTAQDLSAAGIDVPLFVGGAALTRKFTAARIAPEYRGVVVYAKDAMEGLDLANQAFSSETRERLVEQIRAEQAAMAGSPKEGQTLSGQPAAPLDRRRSVVSKSESIPAPPDLDLHILRDVDLKRVYPFLNLQMLYGKHLGLRGNAERLFKERDPKALEWREIIESLRQEVNGNGPGGKRLVRAHGLYRFFPANGDGNDLILYDPDRPDARAEIARFSFPRQAEGERLCLADYVRGASSGELDYVALFAVTCGVGVRELAERWKQEGQYVKSHAVQALAIECAEAFAEMLHGRLRNQWGFPDPAETTRADKFKARYRGIRVSFGYPACPNLADQEILFKLLGPEQIGIELTEGHMMDPEASVSAVVFHHPEAKYFKAQE